MRIDLEYRDLDVSVNEMRPSTGRRDDAHDRPVEKSEDDVTQDIRVAAIGECMVELQELPDGGITQSFGGDTFNTAAYMARLGEGLGAFVDYVSAIGDDPFSDAMAAFWRAQGVGGRLVLRRMGRRPGLYFIKTDTAGERRFFYWRGEAAVREAFETDRFRAPSPSARRL